MSEELTREERIDRMLDMEGKLSKMITLFEDVESALRVFVRIGNAFKWLLGIAGGIAIVWAAIKGFHR